MFVGSFIIQYLLMPAIMVNQRSDITNNLGKAYVSILMALFMIGLEIMMHDHQYSIFSSKLYLVLAFFISVFIYLYRKQVAIYDEQYLEGMIEHHSMAIFMSEEILKKTDNYNIAKLAKNIVQSQKDEIQIMKDLLVKE
jgi:uncharacterized protein (DUF305 family)